ncbi:MAG: hypothetical protein IPO83_18335 [Chitinophagaceae bacterium]|nr:hypothetical protein [Chitinophagaceae bacterium]
MNQIVEEVKLLDGTSIKLIFELSENSDQFYASYTIGETFTGTYVPEITLKSLDSMSYHLSFSEDISGVTRVYQHPKPEITEEISTLIKKIIKKRILIRFDLL